MKEYRINNPVVLWNLTNNCNLKCKHCYQKNGRVQGKELPLARKLNLINEFVDLNVLSIGFSGGEVLLNREELYLLSEKASQEGIFVSVLTNGTLLDKKSVKELKKHGVNQIRIGLDSPFRDLHDNLRGVKGTWKKTIEGILNASEEIPNTKINMAVTRKNLSHLEASIQFSKYLGVGMELTTLIPIGCGKNISEECLNPRQIKEVFEIVSKYSTDGGRGIRINTNPEFKFYLGNYMQEKRREKQPMGFSPYEETGCMAGVGWCAIQPDGAVTPCFFTPDLIVGNVKEKSFVDIWQNSPLFKKLRNRDNLKGNCGDCKDKYDCGGCRGRAYALTNNPLGEDPDCIIFKQREGKTN